MKRIVCVTVTGKYKTFPLVLGSWIGFAIFLIYPFLLVKRIQIKKLKEKWRQDIIEDLFARMFHAPEEAQIYHDTIISVLLCTKTRTELGNKMHAIMEKLMDFECDENDNLDEMGWRDINTRFLDAVDSYQLAYSRFKDSDRI